MNSFFRRIRFPLYVFVLYFFFIGQGNATHLMGGSMTYEFLGMSGPDQQYRVTLKIYRYCDATGGGTAPLDGSMMLGIYNQDPLNPNADKNWFRTEYLPLVSNQFITPPSPGVDCSFNTTVCVEEGIFQADILLPPDPAGYHLLVERCCRNGNIANLSTPGSIGQTYYCFIPPAPVLNSSPQFSDIPVPFICTGDTVSIVNNASDPDGDSLVYAFVLPYAGYSSSVTAIPDPQFDNNPYGWPIPAIMYNPGYSMSQPFGAGGHSFVDPQTGLTNYYIPNQGFFVVAIEISEYRNGVLIARVRRDLQLIAIACPVNAVPVLSAAGGSGITNYTITEGQTLCFPVTFTDPDGDSLYLSASGSIFSAAAVNPPAVLLNASGDGIVTSQFCWNTDCGQARATPYQFVVSVTDNGCPPKITNQVYSIRVNPNPGPPAPAVSIAQDPPGPICNGTSVTFTALPVYGGTSPVYQWQLNGTNVGGNSNTYTSSALVNGDVITVSMTSNSVCVTATNAVSPPVVMVVNPFAAPSVSISATPAGPVCAGTSVAFNAIPTNPGPTPVYQWSVNGTNAGTNAPSFTSSSLLVGDVVAVSLTAGAACPAATSNAISMVVNPVLTPSVLITSDNSGAICPGQTVTFRAYPTYGGTAPSFQWQVNGVNAGTNSNTFASSTLSDGDAVQVILTSSEICLTSPTAASNPIVINVTAPVSPSVSITSNPGGPICAGDDITFTATPVAGGTAPSYQWFVNGVFSGGTSQVFTTSALVQGAQVSVTMTSSLNCLAAASATSNVITVTVTPVLPVSATIGIAPGNAFCTGTSVTFSATVVNGGSAPSYQWQINGIPAGTNSAAFTTSSLNDGDRVKVVVTSNQVCVSPVVAVSNQIAVTVFPLVIPQVSISANPAGPVCQGAQVTFTASPVFPGTSPVYEWLVNGVTAGGNSPVFASSGLNDGDLVKVRMTSGANCPSPATVTSNTVVMNINPVVVPAVSITAVPGGPVCSGTPVTFIAVPVNEGNAPIFQWRINGVFAGFGSTCTTSALNDGDSITVRLNSSATCASPQVVFSVPFIAQVLPYLAPAVTISASSALPVCDGDSIYFSATGVNGGPAPGYQWLLNGQHAGTNSGIFADLFDDGDIVSVIYTSSYLCPLPLVDTSATIVAGVLPNLTPEVTIAVNPTGPVCPGDVVTFTAQPVNGGSAPVYQWLVNGVATGGNSPVFVSGTLNDGDIVKVNMTSSGPCLTAPSDISNAITVQVNPTIIPSVTIGVAPAFPICSGDSVTFQASFTGSGSSPTFTWRVNGIPASITGSQFGTGQLLDGDIIDVVMQSSAFCAVPSQDTSNRITAIINPLLSPSVTITADPPGPFCDGTEITYNASGNNGGFNPSFQWLLNGATTGSGNDTLVSALLLDGDTLQCIYTSSEECLLYNPAYSNQLVIDRLPPLQPVITAPDNICFGQEVHLTAQVTGGNGGPYFLTVDNGLGTGGDFTFIPAQTAMYTVTASDSCSTTRQASVTIVVNPLPQPAFTFDPENPDILNSVLEFTNQSSPASAWIWDFGDGSGSVEEHPDHVFANPGYYPVTLTVITDAGCSDSLTREVHVRNVVTWYIPNSFTPNGDGVNDVFSLSGNAVSGYELVIYSRWGQELFRSSGMDGWDGRDREGKETQAGVYIYAIRVSNDPEKRMIRGTVTLIR